MRCLHICVGAALIERGQCLPGFIPFILLIALLTTGQLVPKHVKENAIIDWTKSLPMRCVKIPAEKWKKEKPQKYSSNSFRSSDLGVMGPARFHLRHAAVLDIGYVVLLSQIMTRVRRAESETFGVSRLLLQPVLNILKLRFKHASHRHTFIEVQLYPIECH